MLIGYLDTCVQTKGCAMVVEMVPEEQLLEQRLDGLEKKVDDGFKAVDKSFEAVDRRFGELNKKVDDGFEAVDKRFDAVDRRFERVEGRLSESNGQLLALHRLLIRVSIGGGVAISLSLLGIIAQLALTLS